MRIPVALKIAGLTLAATGFYTYVGQLVPQKEVLPPEAPAELAADLTTEEMVEIGRQIVEGKGLCLTCHTIGQQVPNARFPDLAGIAERAGEQVAGLSALEYMAQSLYEPETYIVPGFTGGMPPIDRPPVGLNDEEIRTVIAYLQTLGGEATITMDTPLPYGENAGAVPAEEPAPDAGAEAGATAPEPGPEATGTEPAPEAPPPVGEAPSAEEAPETVPPAAPDSEASAPPGLDAEPEAGP